VIVLHFCVIYDENDDDDDDDDDDNIQSECNEDSPSPSNS